MQQLPAWIVTLAGVAHPARVLAVAQSALFTPPPAIAGPGSAGGVTLIDDRTLKFGSSGRLGGRSVRGELRGLLRTQGPCRRTRLAREIPKPSTTTTAPVICASGDQLLADSDDHDRPPARQSRRHRRHDARSARRHLGERSIRLTNDRLVAHDGTTTFHDGGAAARSRPSSPRNRWKNLAPTMPTIMRMTPTVCTLNPLACAVTAKRMMAPAATRIRLVVMPMVGSFLGLGRMVACVYPQLRKNYSCSSRVLAEHAPSQETSDLRLGRVGYYRGVTAGSSTREPTQSRL